MKKLSCSITIICLTLLLFIACEQQPKVAEVGKLAPDFTLRDRKGKTWNLAELKGQVVFVNFWSPWCVPCIKEMPSMQRLYSSMPANEFKMLAILIDDTPAVADRLVAKQKYTFPILMDPENKTSKAYGLTGVPETYIIDKQGVLREKFLGAVQWDSPRVRQMLTKYTAQR
ncbi:MAG: TlpA family protein disulfide reductase [Planctomycetota bacterium]|jgi:peroxiredoxin